MPSVTRGQVLLMMIALFGSFGITFWLTAPGQLPSSSPALTTVEQLAAYHIATEDELIRDAQAVGLEPSPALTGYVDSIERLDQYTVSVKGWVADRAGDGTPLYILAFGGGELAGSGRTHGQRADVTQALHLADRPAQNVAFAFTFRCELGVLPVLVGIDANRYTPLETKTCP